MRPNGDLTQMRPSDEKVSPELNRMLVKQGWKPHRRMVSTGGRLADPSYSLYRKTLRKGEDAYLSWHSQNALLGEYTTMVLNVVGDDGLAYIDNIHDFSEASALAEDLAESIRAYKTLPTAAKEKAYLFSMPLPTIEEAEEYEKSGEIERKREARKQRAIKLKLKRKLMR